MVFGVLNFRGRFEALNDVFWQRNNFANNSPIQNHYCNPQLDLSNRLPSTPNRDRMQKLRPKEVDVSTSHLETHKPFNDIISQG